MSFLDHISTVSVLEVCCFFTLHFLMLEWSRGLHSCLAGFSWLEQLRLPSHLSKGLAWASYGGAGFPGASALKDMKMKLCFSRPETSKWQCHFCHVLLIKAVIQPSQIKKNRASHLSLGKMSENLWSFQICCNDGWVSMCVEGWVLGYVRGQGSFYACGEVISVGWTPEISDQCGCAGGRRIW